LKSIRLNPLFLRKKPDMLSALVVVFVLAYVAIALEHPLKVNKTASALLAAGFLWTIYALGSVDANTVSHELGESLMSTAQIVFS